MEKSAPEAVDLTKETAATRELYGIGTKETDEFGTALLRARRLVERNVRFIHVISGAPDNSRRQLGRAQQPREEPRRDEQDRSTSRSPACWPT